MDKLLDKIIEKMKKYNALTEDRENEEIVRAGLASSLSLFVTLRNVLKVPILRGFSLSHLP